MQSLCLNVEVLSRRPDRLRDTEEDVFRAAEEFGIDLSRASPARSKALSSSSSSPSGLAPGPKTPGPQQL